MNNKRKTAATPDNDTVLAHINDPAPSTPESTEESEKREPHERIDDRTALAKINSPAKTDKRSNKGS